MPTEEDVVTREPLNVETSWQGLREETTPTREFYTRNNFAIPHVSLAEWRLELEGFDRTLGIDHDALLAREAIEIDVVLECAGNGRTYFEPQPTGTPWRERAVGCARFRGVPLAPLLEEAGVPDDAVELVFQGADGDGAFERSMPVDAARRPDVLLAYMMNGAPLLPRHGAPVRLVVPHWYGVASVKWLRSIRAVDRPFDGHFQTERYVYARSADDAAPSPVREKRVNSLIAEPPPERVVTAGAPCRIAGWAWSGHGEVTRVDVSIDGGASWREASLGPQAGPHAWRAWHIDATLSVGEHVLLCRAHDAAGHTQPAKVEWNVHGYGYNAPRPRVVCVT